MPYPRALYYKVEFWKAIYTKYTTREGVLHDSDDLSIVYTQVELPRNRSKGVVGVQRAKIREALFSILRKRGQNLSAYERKILSKFPKYASRSRLLQATENIRFQLGQSDRFREGIIKSGRYLPHIENVIREENAPDFLKYLPHVESSFQRKAVSKFGAAGLWQIMPRTARQFIKVNYVVDERLDPWIATRAAIKYLKQNHRTLKEWPLAITAYNHGAGGVARAVRTIGSTNIADIAFQYSTPSFGFASRNFYAQFLAAVQVAQDHEQYFGKLKLDQPLEFERIQLKKNTYLREIAREYRFTMDEFREMNPGLRKPALRNSRPIPRGTVVRVPLNSRVGKVMVASIDTKIIREALDVDADEKLEKIISKKMQDSEAPKEIVTEKPNTETMAAQADLPVEPALDDLISESQYKVRDLVGSKAWVRVEINETISQLADWLGVQTADLREWNAIPKQGQARLGQRLIVKFEARSVDSFQQDREDYHRQIREDFFSQYEVEEFIDYEIQVGENLYSLCYQKFDIPPWLLEQFNPSVALWDIQPGTKLKIPVLAEKFLLEAAAE